MFKLSADLTFTHTVPVLVPTDQGHEEQSVKVRYRVIGDDRLAAFDMSNIGQMKDCLRAIIDTIDEVTDINDQPIAYSDEVREQLIDLPFVRLALVQGYYRGVYTSTLGN